MTIPATILNSIDVVIWIVCLLTGPTLGYTIGGLLGRLFGWMVAGSLDTSVGKGGQFGRNLGRLLGILAGFGIAIFGALQLIALLAAHATL